MNVLKRWQRPELTTTPTFGRLFNLRDELDRLFNAPFGDSLPASQLLSVWKPALDLFEDKESLTVKAELPGMKKEDLQISLHDGTLSISGERKSETKFAEAQTYRTERFVGRFQRSVVLPAPVKVDGVKAQYTDGVLTVTLPKTEEAKPKQIQVNVE